MIFLLMLVVVDPKRPVSILHRLCVFLLTVTWYYETSTESRDSIKYISAAC